MLTNAAMQGLGGRWEKVLQLLDEAPARDVLSYGVAMSACCTFMESTRDRLKTSTLSGLLYIYWSSMLSCLSGRGNGGQWPKVFELLEELGQKRRKDFNTLNVTLHACAQGQLWQQGVELLDEMLEMQQMPSWTMYNLGIILAGYMCM